MVDREYKRLCREEKLRQERARTKKIEAQTKLLLASIGKKYALNNYDQFILNNQVLLVVQFHEFFTAMYLIKISKKK